MTALYSLLLLLVSVVSIIENSEAFCSQCGSKNGKNMNNYSSHRSLTMKLEYRNAKMSDINSISELCSESFDGPFQWHQQIQKLQSIEAFKVQLKDRITNLVAKGIKHGMIVAIDTEQPEKNAVVGFLEIGLLPSPRGMEVPAETSDPLVAPENTENNLIDSDSERKSEILEGSDDVSVSDVPSIESVSDNIMGVVGAVIIDDDVNINTAENIAPVSTGEIVENVQDIQSSNNTIGDELTRAANNLINEKRKREEVPYLGNVAVSPTCRRQGVGMKLVRIGLKVCQKWGDKKLYVLVENNNLGAIKMYEKLQFECIVKEEDNINRRMDRTPRHIMSIDVPTVKPKVDVVTE